MSDRQARAPGPPLRERLRIFLPWHEPTRQAVTTGWWGWFPNIPRNRFGRCCWILAVGGVSGLFGTLAVLLLLGAFSEERIGSSEWWGLALAVALFALGSLLFAWHLIHGIALARAEDAHLRALRDEAARSAERVERARRRLTEQKRRGGGSAT